MQGMHTTKRRFSVFPYVSLPVLLLVISSLILLFPTNTRADTSPGTIVTHQVTGPQVPVGQKGTLTVSCASGEQLLSGGFSGNAFEGAVYVVESYPSASNSWTVTVDNTSAPSWVQMTVSAYCLQANYSLATTIVHVANSGSGTAVASCPSGSVLVSGGYAGTTRLTTSSPEGNGWQADTANVYAICATQNAAAAPVASTTFTTPNGTFSSGATVACGSGQLVTGGGFSGIAAGGGTPVTGNGLTSTGWSVGVEGSPYTQATVTVWAVCVSPSGSTGSTPTVTVSPTVAISPTATATPSCVHVVYTVVAQWAGGFTATVTITNSCSTPIEGWTLKFSFPGNQKLTQVWNGIGSQIGQQVTVTNASYNGTIAPGQSVNFGFNGTWQTSNPSPTTFTLNGVPTN